VKEVELTCPLTPEGLSRLREKLQGAVPQGVTQQIDIYYDTATWGLLQQAVFVRVRNNAKLQVKFDEEGSDKLHIECIERAFSLECPLPQEAHDLLLRFLPTWQAAATFSEAVTKNRLVELAHLHKTRDMYLDGRLIIALDHIEGLGEFVEVEIQCEEGEDTGQARVMLERFVHDIQATPLKAGYTELWLQRHNPAAYQCGQYHL